MEKLEIRSSQNSQKWGVAVPAIMLVTMSSFLAPAAGVGAGLTVIAAGIIFRRKIAHYVENPPVRLVFSDSGLEICKYLGKPALIPWKEIQDTGLTYGGKGGPRLMIRVADSSKYLNTFMRFNMSLSEFQISVPVGDLELTPAEIERRIYAARKGDA